MKRKSLASLIIILALASTAGFCHKPVNLDPETTRAYDANEVSIRINELMNATITAESFNAIPTKSAMVIVRFCISANKSLKGAPLGWGNVVARAWVQTTSDPLVQPYLSNQYLQAAVALVNIALSAYMGGM